MVHLVDKAQYDQNVYSKIPFFCTNNWTDLPIANNTNLRVLCEIAIKEIELQFALGNNGFCNQIPKDNERRFLPKRLELNDKATEISAPSHTLEIELSSIQITSILG